MGILSIVASSTVTASISPLAQVLNLAKVVPFFSAVEHSALTTGKKISLPAGRVQERVPPVGGLLLAARNQTSPCWPNSQFPVVFPCGSSGANSGLKSSGLTAGLLCLLSKLAGIERTHSNQNALKSL